MFSQFSVGGRPKSSQRPRVGLTMKVMKDQPQLCFSCEQMFPSRVRLEEHSCPAAAFICSCGTEFPVYADMQDHSGTHEPGHRVLDHKTIVHRRTVTQHRHEEQLRRLAAPAAHAQPHPQQSMQSMQSMWTLPPRGPDEALANKMRAPFMLASKLHVSSSSSSSSSATGAKVNAMLPSVASKVNAMLPSASHQGPGALQQQQQGPLLSTAGSPTADLWTLYQPVVVVKKLESRFDKDLRFVCGKCEMRFRTRRELTAHHNSTHITDKVFGCIGCGVLLSSKKSVPRYHQCNNSFSSSLKMRLITARPFSDRKQPNRMNLANRANNNSKIDLTRAHNAASSYRKVVQQQRPPPSSSMSLPRPLQSSARMQTEFMLANLANKATEMMMAGANNNNKKNGFTCQICHIDFEALQMLQRHKCAKAREFVEQQLQLGKLPNRFRKLTQPSAPVKSPSYPVLHLNGNGNSKYMSSFPAGAAAANMKAAFAAAAATKTVGLAGRTETATAAAAAAAPRRSPTGEGGKADMDDDECFIVENAPVATPVQMFQALNASFHIVQM